jgi:hypothetical protein
MAKPKGALPSAAIDEAVSRALARRLGAANMQDRALGYGRPKHGELAGKQNAVWSEVEIKAADDPSDLEVPHALGSVPVFCTLMFWDNPTTADVFVAARPVFVHRWTTSTCRVAVAKVSGAGTLAGTRLTFLVGGE